MNGSVENFWKTVKISELPVKEEIDRNSVLLIEDSEDTKQMSVALFYNAIEGLANEMIKSIRAKLVEVDSFMKEMQEKEELWESNEIQRQKNETQRLQDEQERRTQFEIWQQIWDDDWKPFYEETVQRETIRISNEEYRVQEFNRWVSQITQWELDEQDRKTNESNRVSNENTRQTNESTRISNETNRITTFNNQMIAINTAISNCETATTNCINVTNRLDTMFEIGTSVPTSLTSQKVYFQYF